MALYCFHCRDGEFGERQRELYREAHWDYIAFHKGDYAVAGLLKNGDKTVGSMLLVKADDETGARAIFEGDPFFTGGVWQAVRLDLFDPLFGDWIDGDETAPDQKNTR